MTARPALALLVVCAACGPSGPPPAISAEQAILDRETQNLGEYLRIDFGELLVAGDLMVVIREELVGDLLAGALPFQTDLAGGYRIRLDAVRVELRTGLALVELDGRASIVDRTATFADLTLYAALDVVGIRGDPPVLEARLEPLALAARAVQVGGLTPPAERLIEELARTRLQELGDSIGPVQLPVSLRESIRLPEVSGGDVTIPALTLDLGVRIDQVLVASRRLWIVLDLDLAAPPAAADDGAPGASP